MTGSKTNEGFVVDPKDQNYNDKGGVGVGVGGPDGGVVGGSYAHLTAGELKKAKCKVMWNVVVISFAFMLLFTAFQSMANLQSSINRVDGLGPASLTTIYAALVVSCMFVPTWLLRKLTVKWAMVVSMLCYSAYIGAQFYPEFYTLIPGAIILGLGAAPMWSAKCTYLTQIGNKYADMCGVSVEPIIVRFFGIFFLFFQMSQVWGNVIASSVLYKPASNISLEDLQTCGYNYCPPVAEDKPEEEEDKESSAVEDNFAISTEKLYTLAGVYLACSLTSVALVTFFVEPLTRYGENERKQKQSGLSLLFATFKHMKKPYQVLIIPLTFWSGIEQGFFGADFTAAYVSCAYGVQNLGWVIIVFGVCDAVCSFSFGFIIKKVGRVPIFLMGAIVNLICIFVFYSWVPNPEEDYVFYIMAGLWGIADAVWQTQINALYGVLFESDEEAAFSNYRLWESFGFIVAYLLQIYTCVYVKIWVVLAVLIAGMAGYLTIELMEKKKQRN